MVGGDSVDVVDTAGVPGSRRTGGVVRSRREHATAAASADRLLTLPSRFPGSYLYIM